MNNGLFYDYHKSYEENYDLGPVLLTEPPPPSPQKATTAKFLGFPVTIPFGIPSGPLLNSTYIQKAFEFGFAVSTYKTVRSGIFPCHPYPNVVMVKTQDELHPNQTPRVTITEDDHVPVEKISITNSFGVPSKDPSVWQEDVKKALSYEKEGDLLILSFMGTVKPGQTQEEFIQDYALAGKLANETGAKALEMNLSCPNIGNEGLVCYNLDVTEAVCKAVRKEIGDTPLILKVGYYKDEKQLARLGAIAQAHAQAVASINTLQVEVVDKNGDQALPGPMRLRSGICGNAIRWAGLAMVEKFHTLRKQQGYTYEIMGIGGVMTPKHYDMYREKGADVVQSATGAMWNPYLAHDIMQKDK